MRNFVLISKDVLRAGELGCYGGRGFPTPHIDDLAARGTVFLRHYTPAPSSAMAYTCMFAGIDARELGRRTYSVEQPFRQCPTLFDELERLGYVNHVIWDEVWQSTAKTHSEVYGARPVYHLLAINHRIGPHKHLRGKIPPRADRNAPAAVLEEVDKALAGATSPVFVWIHLPHVMLGRGCYGGDIDLLDGLVGEIVKRTGYDAVWLTSDHGHMNFEKGIGCYGFHVYEPAVRIPLIIPRHVLGVAQVAEPTTNTQLKDLMLGKPFAPPEFVVSETQYRDQPYRVMMIRQGRYKYIYNKLGGAEELYDLEWDPQENANLLIEYWQDPDRLSFYRLDELYYYPFWEEARRAYERLRKRWSEIWDPGRAWPSRLRRLKQSWRAGLLQSSLAAIRRGPVRPGRWGSRVRQTYR